MFGKLKFFSGLSLFILLGLITVSPAYAKERHNPVCSRLEKEGIKCDARVVVDDKNQPKISVAPSGYGPKQFLGAYGLSGQATGSATVAIVDAYDQPNIWSDLNTYSRQFGIPQINSCPVSLGTSSSPCFQKVNQNGGNFYPSVNSGWALETSLDVEIAHAICQNCNILLVEAKSANYSDLMAAVDRARLMGAKIVSNSYGSNEFSGETAFDTHFNYPGMVFTFSSGDGGYGTSYPAASKYVTSVGGTTLNVDLNNNYLSESAWNGSGSGCSLFETKPGWQLDTLCPSRTIADVSADADPNTGAAIYDSVRYFGMRGWFQVGGTSLASPLIASVYALSGNVPSSSYPYSNTAFLNDVTTGSNGNCGGTYLCTSLVGYDGPTGLGSPKGSSGF